MTKVWFVREGPEPTGGGPEYTLPIKQCVDQLGLAKGQRLSGLGRRPRFGDQTPRPLGMAEYQHVVCEVDHQEATEQGWEAGFYHLDLGPKEVARRLGPPVVG